VNKDILNDKLASSPRHKETMLELEEVPMLMKEENKGKSCWQKLCESTS
jgi:hypothetical protein